jgi:hypothetical protein
MATLETRIQELITALGTDWKTITGYIGNIASLNTTADNLAAAINEVKVTADAAAGGTVADATTSTAGKVELATDAEALAMTVDTNKALVPANLAAVRNVANGFAGLDGSTKIPSSLLPSFVDDVEEYADEASFPGTGETGKIYVAQDVNQTFRWSGSAYVEISASPGSTDAVPEGATNLYYTDGRAQSAADTRITALVGDTDVDLVAAYTTAKA